MKNLTNNSKKGVKKKSTKKKTAKKKIVNANRISQAAFAKMLGVRQGNISDHIKRGNITLVDGKIDPVAAKKELASKIDLTHGRTKIKVGDSEDKGTNQTGNSFSKAKAFKEGYKAKLAELEYKIKTKEYVKAVDVEHAAFTFARRIRDKMLNIPGRVEADIAAITGLKYLEVGKIIKREIEIALKGV